MLPFRKELPFRYSDILKIISPGSLTDSLSDIENLEDSRAHLCCELLSRNFELKMLLVSISAGYNSITAAKLIRHFLNCKGGTVQALSVFKRKESEAFDSKADRNIVFLFSIICLCEWQRSCDVWGYLLKLIGSHRNGLVKERG